MKDAGSFETIGDDIACSSEGDVDVGVDEEEYGGASASPSSSPSSHGVLRLSLDSPLFIILIIVFLHAAATAIVVTPLTDLVADVVYDGNLRAAALFLSLLEGVIAALQFGTDPLWGHLSDTALGRKPPLLLAVSQFGLEMFLLYAWPSWWTLVTMGVLRGLCGVGFTLCSVLLMDLAGSCPQHGPRLLGLYGAASGAGFLVGALGGVIVGQAYGLAYPFLIAAGLEALNAVWIAALLPSATLAPLQPEPTIGTTRDPAEVEADEEDQLTAGIKAVTSPSPTSASSPLLVSSFHSAHTSYNPFRSLRILASSPPLRWLSFAFFLAFLGRAYARIFFVFTKYRLEWAMTANGAFLAFLGLLSILAQGGCMKPMIRRFGEAKTLYTALTLNLLATIGYACLPRGMEGAVILYVLSALTTLGFLLLPLLRAMMSREVAAHSQGLLGGAAASVVTAANLVGAAIYGPLFAYFAGDEHRHHLHDHDQPTDAPDQLESPPGIHLHIHGAPVHFPGAPFAASALILLLAFPAVWRALAVRRERDQLAQQRRRERREKESIWDTAEIASRAYQEEATLLDGQADRE